MIGSPDRKVAPSAQKPETKLNEIDRIGLGFKA